MTESMLWNPASLLIDDPQHPRRHPLAVVVLNQPIHNVDVFLNVCSRAYAIVAVDGGANRIKDLKLSKEQLKICMPHAIVGDMDSIHEDALTYFAERGVTIKKHVDVDCTDFQKGIRYVRENSNDDILDVAAFGGLGGRADHAFAQINDLYRESIQRDPRHGHLYLLTAESVIFVLSKGENIIRTPQTSDTFDESIGIIPIGQPATITTKGLEWDVQDLKTQFGSLVSTSNHIRSEKVEVETDGRVLFTMEFASKPRS